MYNIIQLLTDANKVDYQSGAVSSVLNPQIDLKPFLAWRTKGLKSQLLQCTISPVKATVWQPFTLRLFTFGDSLSMLTPAFILFNLTVFDGPPSLIVAFAALLSASAEPESAFAVVVGGVSLLSPDEISIVLGTS